jgi:predicted metal-binding protein
VSNSKTLFSLIITALWRCGGCGGANQYKGKKKLKAGGRGVIKMAGGVWWWFMMYG